MAEDTLHTDVAVLKTEMSNIQNLFSKLDDAIDRIANASGDISRILAVHDNTIEDLQEQIKLQKEADEKDKEILHRRVSEMKDEVINAIRKLDEEAGNELKEVNARITLLERWKWWVMGGSWAIGFAIATLTSSQVLTIVEALTK